MKQGGQLVTSVLVFCLTLSSCHQAPRESMAEALYYADPSDQQRLQDALRNANVPFEVRTGNKGRKEVWYNSRNKGEVTRIREEVFGVPPPMGRSISLEERNATLVEALRRRHVPFGSARYQGLEFITWPPESDEAADSALAAISVSAEQIRAMREMRRAADAETAER